MSAFNLHTFKKYVYTFCAMALRVQVLLDAEDRARFHRQAKRDGLSLSAWFREAALERLARQEESITLRTSDALDAFFTACDQREAGREPDWPEHLAVISRSRVSSDPDR